MPNFRDDRHFSDHWCKRLDDRFQDPVSRTIYVIDLAGCSKSFKRSSLPRSTPFVLQSVQVVFHSLEYDFGGWPICGVHGKCVGYQPWSSQLLPNRLSIGSTERRSSSLRPDCRRVLENALGRSWTYCCRRPSRDLLGCKFQVDNRR